MPRFSGGGKRLEVSPNNYFRLRHSTMRTPAPSMAFTYALRSYLTSKTTLEMLPVRVNLVMCTLQFAGYDGAQYR